MTAGYNQVMPLLLLLLCLLLGGPAVRGAELSLGFDGEVVAGRWNPFEFRSRDSADITLTVTVDQGDLRRGPLPAVHTWHIPGGTGLSVLEDDIFIPAWQSLTWTATDASRVLASGSFHPRDLDDRPLGVIVSTAAARHGDLLPAGTRSVPHPAANLPERLAAWDPVRFLIIDGSTAPPSASAVLAAAAAGADVLLLEPLPASFTDLLRLAGGTVTRYGAGRLFLGAPDELRPLVAAGGGARELVDGQLDGLSVLEPRPPLRLSLLLPFAAGYALVALLLLRVAGLPGAAAALCLGAIGVAAGWPQLQQEPPRSVEHLEVRVSAGGLSRVVDTVAILDRQGGQLHLPDRFRPLRPEPYRTSDGQSDFLQDRWQLLHLAGRPVLAEALSQDMATPAGDHPLTELFPAGTIVREAPGLMEIIPAEATP